MKRAHLLLLTLALTVCTGPFLSGCNKETDPAKAQEKETAETKQLRDQKTGDK